MTEWHRSKLSNGKVSIAASLLIADEFLQAYPFEKDSKTIRLAAPGKGTAYVIHFVFSRVIPVQLMDGIPDATILGQVQLSADEHFIVVSTVRPFDLHAFAKTLERKFPMEDVEILTDRGGPGLRVAIWNDPSESEEGILQIADIGVGFVHFKQRGVG